MAETKTEPKAKLEPEKKLWRIDRAKFKTPVDDPRRVQTIVEARSDGTSLLVEFDPSERMIVMTALRVTNPEAEPEKRDYVPNASRKPVFVPLENVGSMT